MMAKRTEEYTAMIKATVRLTNAVKNELTSLSQELVARELISVDQGVELRNGNISAVDRAANLVALVTTKVEQDRKNFYHFVEILNDNQSTYKEILKDLQPIYTTGNHVYNKGACAVLDVHQPWYHRKLSRQEAEDQLGDMDTHSFLVRESAKEVGKLVLSVKSHDDFYHFPIERGFGQYQVEGTEEPFPSVIELIDHYKQHGLLESNNGDLVFLKSPCICDVSLPSEISRQSKAVTIGACISVEKLPANMFHVTSIGGDGKGIMQVTETELIFTEKRTTESWRWPLKFLRRYGCDKEVFSFEAGRKCPGGAGLYAFESECASQIVDMVAWNINPGNLQPPAGELSPFPSQSHPPDQNTLVSRTSVSPSPGSNHVDQLSYANRDLSGNPLVQAENGIDPTLQGAKNIIHTSYTISSNKGEKLLSPISKPMYATDV